LTGAVGGASEDRLVIRRGEVVAISELKVWTELGTFAT
jgi:hypothetical protein